MRKYTLAGVVAAIGVLIYIFGGWAKLTHQAYADMTLRIGLFCLCTGTGLAIVFWLFSIGQEKKKK